MARVETRSKLLGHGQISNTAALRRRVSANTLGCVTPSSIQTGRGCAALAAQADSGRGSARSRAFLLTCNFWVFGRFG